MDKNLNLQFNRVAHFFIGYWLGKIFNQNLIRMFVTPECFTDYFNLINISVSNSQEETDNLISITRGKLLECLNSDGIVIPIVHNDILVIQSVWEQRKQQGLEYNIRALNDNAGLQCLGYFLNKKGTEYNESLHGPQKLHENYGRTCNAVFLIISDFNLEMAKKLITDFVTYEMVSKGYSYSDIYKKVMKLTGELIDIYHKKMGNKIISNSEEISKKQKNIDKISIV